MAGRDEVSKPRDLHPSSHSCCTRKRGVARSRGIVQMEPAEASRTKSRCESTLQDDTKIDSIQRHSENDTRIPRRKKGCPQSTS